MSCLWAGEPDQFPAGTIISTTIKRSAASSDGSPKLWTCLDAGPAPRVKTGTLLAGMYLSGKEFFAGASAIMNRPAPEIFIEVSIERYRTSVGPLKTVLRPNSFWFFLSLLTT